MKLSFLLLATVPMACHCANDVDLQQRQRNLFFLRRSCRRKVKDCRAELGSDRPPYDKWMEGLATDDDLFKLIASAKTVDMTSFVQNAKVQDRKAYRKFRSGNIKDLAEALERSETITHDLGDRSAEVSEESLKNVVASANDIFGTVFNVIGSVLGYVIVLLLAPIILPPILIYVCGVNGDPICAAIAYVLTFILAIVFLPIWLPVYGLWYLLFGCYGEQLQCQFDSLMSKAVPLLLERSASSSKQDGPAP